MGVGACTFKDIVSLSYVITLERQEEELGSEGVRVGACTFKDIVSLSYVITLERQEEELGSESGRMHIQARCVYLMSTLGVTYMTKMSNPVLKI